MTGFPQSTEFNRRIPKQVFYEKMSIPSSLKRFFIDQIKTIIWRNKIASTTTNLATGATVNEIEVIEIHLNARQLDESVLRQIDTEIPYHILFLLEYNGLHQAWIAYKETTKVENKASHVGSYYHTAWMSEADLPLKIEGLNIDQAYENFVRQIAGNALCTVEGRPESLKETVEREKHHQELSRKIKALENKIRKEPQLNRQMELNAELKQLKRELEELKHG